MVFFGFGVGFVFDWSWSGLFLHVVDGANHEEDNKGNDEEIDGGLNEVAVVDGGRVDALDVGGNDKLEARKVEAADEHGNYGHDDVVD